MTDEDLTGAGEARARARALLERAARRRLDEPPDDLRPEAVAAVNRVLAERAAAPSLGPGEPGRYLHDLLRDLAAYLGDRPQRDAEAMGLYERVMRMLGTGAE
jgi:hypothetical protein